MSFILNRRGLEFKDTSKSDKIRMGHTNNKHLTFQQHKLSEAVNG